VRIECPTRSAATPWQKTPTYNGPNYSANATEPEMGFLKDFMTRFRVPEGTNWGWYQNAEVDKLGAEVMQTFDDVEQTKILQRLHEIAV